MNNSLKFGSNWRSLLWILKNGSSVDMDVPLSYVYLDSRRVPNRDLEKFCKKNWNRFAFDYDPANNFYIWPVESSGDAQRLVDSINKEFPKCANLVKKRPSEVHNLYFDDSEDDDLSF
jgi:hypothetical protein